MGHKVNPRIFRIGHSVNWNSRWFSAKNYVAFLKQDVSIRKLLMGKLNDAGIDKIEIERNADSLNVIVHSSRPGVVIGKGGTGINELKKKIVDEIVKNKKQKIEINIKEVSKPNLSANIVAQNIAADLEKRIPFRRAVKRAMEQVMKAGAKGVKVVCSGRLGGVDIARTETLSDGKMPLHTLRSDIDYSRLAARTSTGAIGVKVWICRGEYFAEKDKTDKQAAVNK